jgi:SAM-dependent methyltransferase
VESDASCHATLAAAGLRVHSSTDEIADAERFDLLVMSHVLEHVGNPRAVLTSLVSRLSPGALVFIEVPCRDFEHKAEDEPHLLFFDREPMTRLLERCGIKPIHVSYHGVRIDALRRGRFARPSMLRRAIDRLMSIADRRALLPIPKGLRPLDDPALRAAVRRFEAHLEHHEPSWWLRAVGEVEVTRSA